MGKDVERAGRGREGEGGEMGLVELDSTNLELL